MHLITNKIRNPALGAKATLLGLTLIILLACYILSILWRVSIAEQELYGRSYLIPLGPKIDHNEAGTPASFYDNTYSVVRDGKTVHVYKQVVNSFQHAYGSALAAFELGSGASDLLFRANEYAEGIVCGGAGTEPFMLDARKDLYNNSVGREIGVQARAQNLNGAQAQEFMITEILHALDQGRIYNSFRDSRVAALPSFEQYGCPGLFQIQWARKELQTMLNALHKK